MAASNGDAKSDWGLGSIVEKVSHNAPNAVGPPIYSEQTALRNNVDQRLFKERWQIVQGAVAITIAISVAIWPRVNPVALIAWIAGYVVWVVIALWARLNLSNLHQRDRYQTPRLVNLTNAGRGLWICAVAFVNWDAFVARDEYFWTLLTLISSVMAASIVCTTVANDYFIQSILVAVIILTAAAGQWPICIGACLFLWTAIQALDRNRHTRISEVKLQAKLAYQACTDSLTGLWNRVGLAEQVAQLPAKPLGALFLDLDRFKEVNDRLGHAAGDELLSQVAQRLSQIINDRPHILARLGGDEFLLVLPGCALHELLAIADTALQSLEQPFTLTAGQAYISASIGTAINDGSKIELEQLIRESDEAMYRAKQAGRRRVMYYDAALHQDAQQRLGLESHLRQAIAEHQIMAWGQPIFSRGTKQIAKVELLARWELNQKQIPPPLFIGVATDIGITSDIAKAMVNHAKICLDQWRHWPALTDTIVTVNIEAQDLVEGRIVDFLENLIFTTQIDPTKLVLEITERGLIEAENKARFQIDRLHRLGIQVAIDDFGAGYSSLQSVFTLPVDLLKFDRSLVSAAAHNQRMQKVLGAMVEMANGLNIDVIGEGIETADDVENMRQINVNLLQGFYCARPMPIGELASFATEAAKSF